MTDNAVVQTLNAQLQQQLAERTAELRAVRELFQAVMDSAHEAIFFEDRAGRYLVFNRIAEQLTGIASADAIGKTAIDLLGPEVGGRLRAEEELVMATGIVTTREETFPLHVGERTFLTTRSPHRDEQGAIIGMVGLSRDITDLKAAQREILQQRDRLQVAASAGGLGIWDYDIANDALHCEPRWYEILGRDPAQPIKSIGDFKPFIHPDDVARATEVKIAAAELLASGQNYAIDFRIVRPTGEVRWVRSTACIFEDDPGVARRATGFIVDVTDSRKAEDSLKKANDALQQANAVLAEQREELERLSLEDKLTGIANRRCFDIVFERVHRNAARTGEPYALAMIDIDFFKQYNDKYGHLRGDGCLRVVAQTLASIVKRPLDLAARYGGEEFVILLADTTNISAVLERLCDSVRSLGMPHAGSPAAPHVTVSCGGIVVDDVGAVTPAMALARCDETLYRVKKSGRDGFALWTPESR